MKKSYYIFLTLICLVVSSCDDFLNETLEGTYTSDTFYKTQAHAELALAGIYNIASFRSTNNGLWVFGDVASDDAVKGGLAGDQSDIQFLEEFNYSRNNPFLDNIWTHYYEGINRANYLIHYGENISMEETRKNEILGQAKFLRAFFYFNLVNIFGEVPLRIQPPLNQDLINLPKSSVETVYEGIVSDLKDAAEVLNPAPTGVGEVSQGAAYGLLAKAYLFQEEWQLALDAIEDLELAGAYALEPVYKNNFIDSTQNNSESIFEIQHLSGQSPLLGSALNQYFSPASENGYYFNAPVQDFVNEFEQTEEEVVDPRLDYTVGRVGQVWLNGEQFDPTWSATGYLVKKHSQPLREIPKGTKGDADLNYVYMRFADVLLMKAETLNELQRTGEALIPLNLVRKRARESYLYDESLPGFGAIPSGLLPDVTSLSQDVVRVAIQHERRVELGFEFHRYFDLMRYGKAEAEAALANMNFNFDEDRYFLIPQSEIDANPLISN
jgi:starch-binding outer membrane protein, SusD/RagB family